MQANKEWVSVEVEGEANANATVMERDLLTNGGLIQVRVCLFALLRPERDR